MQSCEQPRFFLDADIVWIESPSPDAVRSPVEGPLTIGEVAEKFGVTLRTLRFYESRGLIKPARERRTRLYRRSDCDRIALILKGKKLGFTLSEISRMIAANEGRASAEMLRLSRAKCIEQIDLLERQLRDTEDAIAELRRLHLMLAGHGTGPRDAG